jgi:HSP20 family protein
MDRLFDDFFASPAAAQSRVSQGFQPSAEVAEIDNHYLISLDMPGLKKEDIKIHIVGDQMIVSGERKEEHEESSKGRFHSERLYGSFHRAFPLPKGTTYEQIEAEYSDGVLQIALPKAQESGTKSISVKEGKPGFLERLTGKKPSDKVA